MALIDDVVGYWKLEEDAANTTVVDSHGTNTGTSSSMPSNVVTNTES